MPITKGAKKAHKASLNKNKFNVKTKKEMKEAIKEVRSLVHGKDKAEALGKLPDAYKRIDKAAKKGIIKKNTAARRKSRLTKQVTKIS